MITLGLALAVIGALAVVFASGADQQILRWALAGQREAQNGMAHALRALRAGEPAALAGFLAVCFGYGFFHAAGPGHGKLLIGGYGAARAVGAGRLSAVALISSLAQGGTAIALVAFGLWVWSLGRAQMTDLADRLLTPLSFGAIALIGVWLVWRGARGLIAATAGAAHHHHDHGPDDACASCGHSHAPDPARLAAATGWRDMALLVGAVAIRPCTGALFILILTAQMGLFAIGVAGTIAMALGTASVTIAVALAAVTLRRGVLAGLAQSPALARVQPMIEIAAGAVVAVLAGQLVLASL
jgi:nickel/cobalt exporter